jgi:hypothetical protein
MLWFCKFCTDSTAVGRWLSENLSSQVKGAFYGHNNVANNINKELKTRANPLHSNWKKITQVPEKESKLHRHSLKDQEWHTTANSGKHEYLWMYHFHIFVSTVHIYERCYKETFIRFLQNSHRTEKIYKIWYVYCYLLAFFNLENIKWDKHKLLYTFKK